jgi:hypothetical protein
MAKKIVTCKEDGFQWKIVDAIEAKKIFTVDDKEVFVLDENNVEYLVDDVEKFDDTTLRFAIPMGFKKGKGSDA